MKYNTISIVVATDNFYAILMAALLKSIEVNHKTNEHIDFYIIDDGISSKSRKRLKAMVDPSRITLKWFKTKELGSLLKGKIPIDGSGFPITTYLRFFAPYIVDKDADKVLYLDVDMILQEDISKLWNIDLGNYTLGAVVDIGETVSCEWGGVPNYKELGLEADTKYFNAGLLLINAKKWREEDISNEILEAMIRHKEYVRLADQYGLNVVMAKRWLELDRKWNWFAVKEDQKPYLIHFLDIKPIFKSYNSNPVFKEVFFKYLAMTPWKNYKPTSGNKRLLRKVYNKIKKTLMRKLKSQ